MIATQTPHTAKERVNYLQDANALLNTDDTLRHQLKHFSQDKQQFLPSRAMMHDAQAGLNPIVDASAYLFSVLGKLKNLKAYRQLNKLQKELITEINHFQETIKNHGYNPEYVVVCRFVICATFDDILSDTRWGSQGHWQHYSLLASYNQDAQYQEKFFTIMERAIKEPALYIDLMELMYICLSMGYKGQYRATEHNQYQLEQITHHLYKHIRAYRGNFSKTLSPMPIQAPRLSLSAAPKQNSSSIYIFFVTACIIMTIFISLGYLMDVISNEAYQPLIDIGQSVFQQ